MSNDCAKHRALYHRFNINYKLQLLPETTFVLHVIIFTTVGLEPAWGTPTLPFPRVIISISTTHLHNTFCCTNICFFLHSSSRAGDLPVHKLFPDEITKLLQLELRGSPASL